MFRGQLDTCRLFFRNRTEQSNLCVCNDYSDNVDALETLMNISTVGEHKSLALDMSLPATKIRYCEGNNRSVWLPDGHRYYTEAYPGGKITIHLIALGQTDYPVPARIHWERYYNIDGGHRLSLPSQIINGTCTNISFQLHSVKFGYTRFKLYPQNGVCQNLIHGLILRIKVLPCPLGFALLVNNSRCVCDKKLKILAQNCYIDSNSESIKRMKNSFWIFKQSNDTLILHEYRCPLDYCVNHPVTVKLDDPFIQCDFNRTGILCGQCEKTYSLALAYIVYHVTTTTTLL